jgi:glucokinase
MQLKYAIGIDIGGTSTKIARVTSQGEVQDILTLPTSGNQGVEAYIHSVLDKAEEFLQRTPPGISDAGIGLAVAGFVDPLHTRMVFNPNIGWLENYPLHQTFSNRFDLPVQLEIDSNAAVLAEHHFGVGAGYKRFFVYSIGTGVGGGMVVDGELLRISNECLGDIGHVIVEPGGPECTAGCKGCAEAMISAPGLERLTRQLAPDYPTSRLHSNFQDGNTASTQDIIHAAKAGDELAIRAIEQVGKWLGIALASITPVFAPDCIAIAGGVSEAGELIRNAAEEKFRSICGGAYAAAVEVRSAKLGWQAVVVGAACQILYNKPIESFERR